MGYSFFFSHFFFVVVVEKVELQTETEHLIQRLNHEVTRTREDMMSKMRNELNETTKHTMEENSR